MLSLLAAHGPATIAYVGGSMAVLIAAFARCDKVMTAVARVIVAARAPRENLGEVARALQDEPEPPVDDDRREPGEDPDTQQP